MLAKKTALESLSLYKNIFSKTLDPSVIFDKKGKIHYFNDILLETGNYKSGEVIGKPVEILTPEKERKRMVNMIENVLKSKSVFRDFNTFLLTKKNKEIPVALTILPLKDKNKLIGGLAIFVDIRQLKGILESLEKAKSDLEKKVRERTKELENRTSELSRAKVSLEEAKNVLEIKVKARTRELSELNKTLEEKVKGRTAELQERIEELNRFFKLMVGRELRMIELKEEINRLKVKEEKKT